MTDSQQQSPTAGRSSSSGKGVRRPRVQQDVIPVLAGRVLSGEWEVGSTIPTAEELCSEFGVSRSVIREATRVLASKGLMVAKPRAGTTVTPRTDWNILDPDIAAWMAGGQDRTVLNALMEARRVIEPTAARLAAMRATPADIAALHDAWSRMATSWPDDLEACSDADLDFHTSLLAASHNVVFAQFASVIRTTMRALLKLSNSVGSTYDDALNKHHAVIEAIRLRQPDEAEARLLELLGISERDLGPALG